MEKDITFSDVLIEPQLSSVKSRSDVSLTSDFSKFAIDLPVFSSNMPDVTEYKMAITMWENGGMGILHRFMSIEENVTQYKAACDEIYRAALPLNRKVLAGYECGVSIGIQDEERERFEVLYAAGARLFCIDIAHGHSEGMRRMIEWIRSHETMNDVYIIAGNVATGQGAIDLASWGANAIKVGIGPGRVCTTRSRTGIGVSQFTAIDRVYEALESMGCFGEHLETGGIIIRPMRIIADGGIRTSGDVGKALIRSHGVMLGGVFAGTLETPGPVFTEPGTDLIDRRYFKYYGGSASAENKIANGNGCKPKFVEGERIKVPLKGHAKYLMDEIREGVQSTFSYSNAKTLEEYHSRVKWNGISSGAKEESKI